MWVKNRFEDLSQETERLSTRLMYWICDALRNLILLIHLKNVKNCLGGVLLLIKLILLRMCFKCFLNFTNGNKLHKASRMFKANNGDIRIICCCFFMGVFMDNMTSAIYLHAGLVWTLLVRNTFNRNIEKTRTWGKFRQSEYKFSVKICVLWTKSLM